ncbi:hypothetical protein PLESTB_000393400 [Pleodorina starrii]|uniref:Uncharacterized protein n=1 Tax=Pleodorina starrii TaxID=330485 RepID=A0A9W6BE79_9CHLO|nr:hypothetical protein PLESTB_000393400 [Pleodorina starrii]
MQNIVLISGGRDTYRCEDAVDPFSHDHGGSKRPYNEYQGYNQVYNLLLSKATLRQRRLLGAVKQNSSCIYSSSTCAVDLRFFANLTAAPATDIQKLLARSIADQCYPEDTANVTEKGCPLQSDNIFHASLLRNYVYCPGSLLDQAIACLETTTNGSCSANAACMWTDRFFGVKGGGVGTNASVTMMSAVDSAISNSVGWLKGPHDTDLATNYYSDSVVMPFKYCAARWTINETVLASLYNSFSGWQKAAFEDYNMRTSAAALLGTAGQAITGT